MANMQQILDALGHELKDFSQIEHKVSAGQKHVFKASHGKQQVALKAIFVGLEPESENLSDEIEQADELNADAERLRREIEILRSCRSEHIVRLSRPEYFEFAIDRERFAAYGEQWVDGDDLARLFRARRLTRDETISLALSLCAAIEELDKNGYVHRDIKPQNIMLRRDGVFLLVDPGMALDRGGRSLTQAGTVLGTVDYMSPEQWDPNRKRDLDVRSDMFAVGVVLFEALAGVHPFAERGMVYRDIMTASRSRERRELANSAIPDGDPLRTIIGRLLAPKPHGRYRDTEAFRRALLEAR